MAKKLVLDSSVISKWLNKNHEAHIEQADKILNEAYEGTAELLAPELVKYELGKLLVAGKKLSQSEAKIPLTILFDLPIQFIAQTRELSKESYAIASEFGLTYNESVFLALAEEKGAILVTDNPNTKANATGTKIIALRDY